MYDSTIRAKRTIEIASVNDTNPELLDILELYDERVAYVVNVKDRTCQTVKLDIPFISHDIPRAAQFMAYESIGVAGAGGTVLSQWRFDDATSNFHMYLTYTLREEDCVPVRFDFVDDSGFHYNEFSDLEIGVDPNVFRKPSIC